MPRSPIGVLLVLAAARQSTCQTEDELVVAGEAILLGVESMLEDERQHRFSVAADAMDLEAQGAYGEFPLRRCGI